MAIAWPVLALCGCAGSPSGASCNATAPAFTVSAGLFDESQRDTLGLEAAGGTETTTIFRPGAEDNTYNHGVVLVPFKGRLYAQWQSSRRDEDAADTHVVYSSSEDGVHWTGPVVLAPEWASGYRTSGGWWTDGETLIAFINEWPTGQVSRRGGHTRFLASDDGLSWTAAADVMAADGRSVEGVIEQDPHALPDGRVIGAFHVQPGLTASPFFTDDPLATSGWTRGFMDNLPFDRQATSRELEPSTYLRVDGAAVMIFRDQAGSYRKLAAVSCDRGASWTRPVLTGMPDARTKQSAGNLPDGTAYLAGNPVGHRDRYPLVLVLSSGGHHFDRAFLLRGGGAALPPLRVPGRYKRAGYSYPKSVTWRGYLYVAYATGKEDIELTRVPLESLR